MNTAGSEFRLHTPTLDLSNRTMKDSQFLSLFVPVRKNIVLTVYHDTVKTIEKFRFFYAVGSSPTV